ncbi:MAG: ABC transporter permease [Candidatus Omnitrophica bacterium]|nr:ABC transporter permease [Candidatus Omnitrophota bacterium]MDD5487665.1 ABC transporter permease [Candidatus Omnitrophota bacterium]
MRFARGLKHMLMNTYSPLILLVLWEVSVRCGFVNSIFIPTPSSLFSEFSRLVLAGTLAKDCGISLMRILAGLVVGGLPGLILGVFMGRKRSVYLFMNPLVNMAYPVPKIALIPFIILMLGIGEASKITVIALGAFFIMLINTCHGVSSIDRRYFDVARVYKFSAMDRWLDIIIPASMPSMFNGIRLSSGLCFSLVVAAEFIGGSSGIGYRLWTSWEAFDIKRMFVSLIVISLMGWAFNAIIDMIGERAMPWKART